jgi:hypothetical protein
MGCLILVNDILIASHDAIHPVPCLHNIQPVFFQQPMLVCKQPSGEICASSLLSNHITPQAVQLMLVRRRTLYQCRGSWSAIAYRVQQGHPARATTHYQHTVSGGSTTLDSASPRKCGHCSRSTASPAGLTAII